jgi:hypothetical protein
MAFADLDSFLFQQYLKIDADIGSYCTPELDLEKLLASYKTDGFLPTNIEETKGKIEALQVSLLLKNVKTVQKKLAFKINNQNKILQELNISYRDHLTGVRHSVTNSFISDLVSETPDCNALKDTNITATYEFCKFVTSNNFLADQYCEFRTQLHKTNPVIQNKKLTYFNCSTLSVDLFNSEQVAHRLKINSKKNIAEIEEDHEKNKAVNAITGKQYEISKHSKIALGGPYSNKPLWDKYGKKQIDLTNNIAVENMRKVFKQALSEETHKLENLYDKYAAALITLKYYDPENTQHQKRVQDLLIDPHFIGEMLVLTPVILSNFKTTFEYKSICELSHRVKLYDSYTVAKDIALLLAPIGGLPLVKAISKLKKMFLRAKDFHNHVVMHRMIQSPYMELLTFTSGATVAYDEIALAENRCIHLDRKFTIDPSNTKKSLKEIQSCYESLSQQKILAGLIYAPSAFMVYRFNSEVNYMAQRAKALKKQDHLNDKFTSHKDTQRLKDKHQETKVSSDQEIKNYVEVAEDVEVQMEKEMLGHISRNHRNRPQVFVLENIFQKNMNDIDKFFVDSINNSMFSKLKKAVEQSELKTLVKANGTSFKSFSLIFSRTLNKREERLFNEIYQVALNKSVKKVKSLKKFDKTFTQGVHQRSPMSEPRCWFSAGLGANFDRAGQESREARGRSAKCNAAQFNRRKTDGGKTTQNLNKTQDRPAIQAYEKNSKKYENTRLKKFQNLHRQLDQQNLDAKIWKAPDKDMPASLSSKAAGIIRKSGFPRTRRDGGEDINYYINLKKKFKKENVDLNYNQIRQLAHYYHLGDGLSAPIGIQIKQVSHIPLHGQVVLDIENLGGLNSAYTTSSLVNARNMDEALFLRRKAFVEVTNKIKIMKKDLIKEADEVFGENNYLLVRSGDDLKISFHKYVAPHTIKRFFNRIRNFPLRMVSLLPNRGGNIDFMTKIRNKDLGTRAELLEKTFVKACPKCKTSKVSVHLREGNDPETANIEYMLHHEDHATYLDKIRAELTIKNLKKNYGITMSLGD